MLFKNTKRVMTISLLCLTALTFIPGYSEAKVNTANVVHKCSKQDTKENLLACAVYAESRGQGKKGMVAVGNVVINRVNSPEFPKSIRGVLYQPGQFSYTYQGAFSAKDQQSWLEAKAIAAQLLYLDNNFPEAREAIDITKGATYFKKRTMRTRWERDMVLVYRYKDHQFYRQED